MNHFSSLPKVKALHFSSSEEKENVLKKHKISLLEWQKILEIKEGQIPTLSELGVFSAMWSEHCSYKSSRIHLKNLPSTGEQVVVGPGENAGVVRLHAKLCVAFKMESHNHPSYIEPYHGAATGVGGILRDVFCMGARPVANYNCLRFGVKSHPKTKTLFEYAVKGIGDYGNCMGIPTLGGNISFDESYNGNCLVNAMTVGLVHEDRIFKGYASGVGNLVVYAGSATGRDGIHGATMASDKFSSTEKSEKSTVQVGDPFMEKLLLEATLEVLKNDLAIGLQDMGAAGLTSSSIEMGGRAENGVYIDLNKIPIRTSKMSAYELLLSESQERMLFVVSQDKLGELSKVFERFLLNYAVIGEVTDTGRFQASFDGHMEVDLPISPLTEMAPKYDRPRAKRKFSETLSQYPDFPLHSNHNEKLEYFLSRIGGGRKSLFEQYDRHIGSKTILCSDHGGASLIDIDSNCLWEDNITFSNLPKGLGLLISSRACERLGKIDPKAGATLAVLEAARQIVAASGEPLAITDCLNFGNPENPEVMHEFAESIAGISLACRTLNIPVVSGNVSLYNETDGEHIKPTPMIGMVGKTLIKDKAKGAKVFDKKYQDLNFFVIESKNVSPLFFENKENKNLAIDEFLNQLLKEEQNLYKMIGLLYMDNDLKLTACKDVGRGGVLTGFFKMVLPYLSKGYRFELLNDLSFSSTEEQLTWLYGEYSCRFITAFSKPLNECQELLAKISQSKDLRNTIKISHLAQIMPNNDQASSSSYLFKGEKEEPHFVDNLLKNYQSFLKF